MSFFDVQVVWKIVEISLHSNLFLQTVATELFHCWNDVIISEFINALGVRVQETSCLLPSLFFSSMEIFNQFLEFHQTMCTTSFYLVSLHPDFREVVY